ncbi:polyisoprenoid diphosphate/phosphate phosphohydrolase PLPP6-like [Ornithodoros turicata]
MGSEPDDATEAKKRDLPPPGWKRNPFLLSLKRLDELLSERCFLAASEKSPLGHRIPALCMLERTAHSALWFGGLLLLMWFFSMDPPFRTFLFNVFLALTLDVILVAILKATCRRRRPGVTREQYESSPQASHLSFPSGFTSRAVLVALIAVDHSHLFPLFKLPFVVWCCAVAVCKLLMGRQFVGDSLGGLVLGYLEYHLVVVPMWLSQDSVGFFFNLLDDDAAVGVSL